MTATLSITTADLSPVAPFEFAKTLDFHRNFAPFGSEPEQDAESLTRAVRIAGRTVGFRVQSTGTVEAPRLHVTFYSEEPLDNDVLAEAIDRVSFFLSIADDMRPFYELARQDAPFRPVMEHLYGYHQVKFLTPFENACWSILTQRTNFSVASTFKQRLTDRFGGKLTINGRVYQAFPQAEDFGLVSAAELAEMVSNERRGSFLHSVVTAFQGADEEFLRHGDYDQVEAWMRGIKGVGEWTAIFVMMRGLGRIEKALLADKNSNLMQMMLQSAERIYGPVTIDQLHERAAYYGVYQGYWTHYMRANGG